MAAILLRLINSQIGCFTWLPPSLLFQFIWHILASQIFFRCSSLKHYVWLPVICNGKANSACSLLWLKTATPVYLHTVAASVIRQQNSKPQIQYLPSSVCYKVCRPLMDGIKSVSPSPAHRTLTWHPPAFRPRLCVHLPQPRAATPINGWRLQQPVSCLYGYSCVPSARSPLPRAPTSGKYEPVIRNSAQGRALQ